MIDQASKVSGAKVLNRNTPETSTEPIIEGEVLSVNDDPFET